MKWKEYAGYSANFFFTFFQKQFFCMNVSLLLWSVKKIYIYECGLFVENILMSSLLKGKDN